MATGAAARMRSGAESRMDRDICAAVHEELVADPRVDADDIVVEVFDGDATLNGTVPSQVARLTSQSGPY